MRCFHTSAATHVSLPLMSQEQQSSDSPWCKAAGHKEPSRGSDTWGTSIQITSTRARWWTRNTRSKLKAKAVLLTLGQDQASPLWACHAKACLPQSAESRCRRLEEPPCPHSRAWDPPGCRARGAGWAAAAPAGILSRLTWPKKTAQLNQILHENIKVTSPCALHIVPQHIKMPLLKTVWEWKRVWGFHAQGKHT